MLDSTYINASDPNSMRDCGGTRNCDYVAELGMSFNETLGKSDSKPTYDRYLSRPL